MGQQTQLAPAQHGVKSSALFGAAVDADPVYSELNPVAIVARAS